MKLDKSYLDHLEKICDGRKSTLLPTDAVRELIRGYRTTLPEVAEWPQYEPPVCRHENQAELMTLAGPLKTRCRDCGDEF